ncbi:MAG: hypothetical protein M3014_12320 [Chloroflexota bacterium]|nr:hypothetical protein [Chloroflexota bacterium]
MNNSNRHNAGLRHILLLGALALAAPLVVQGPAYAAGDSRFFPETGKSVKSTFYTYWLSHGGLAQQGYPISEEMQEKSDTDGKIYKVQYFERAIFEQHPEYADTPNEVLLSLLGVFLYEQKYPHGASGQSISSDPGVKTFPETHYHLGGKFLHYWQEHGGLAQQGEAISEEFDEVSALNGRTYRVQYFERAVFELHPEYAGTENEVLLSQLGTFRYRAKYQAAPASNSTTTPTTSLPNVMPTATPTSSVAYANPTATPRPVGVNAPCPPDFLGVSLSGFDACYSYWTHAGFSPVTLTAYQMNNVTLMGGSFQQVDPPRQAMWNMTLPEFQNIGINLKGQQLAPDQVSVLQTTAGPRFTAVWSKTYVPFEFEGGLTYSQYQQRDTQRRSEGFVNTDVWAYTVTGGLQLGGTWVKRAFTDYATVVGLDLTNYHSIYDSYTKQGFSPKRFEPFTVGGGKYLNVIFEKVPGSWEVRANLSQDEAQLAYNALGTQGYHLYSVRALNSLFSIIWNKP